MLWNVISLVFTKLPIIEHVHKCNQGFSGFSDMSKDLFFLYLVSLYIKSKAKVEHENLWYTFCLCILVLLSVCVCHRGWLWCIYCSELVWNNSSILARVSGGRQQHSAFPALCVPARLGLGLGFHSHLELRAQECHCSSFQTMAGSDTHAKHTHIHINRHMHVHTLSTQYEREAHTSLCVPWNVAQPALLRCHAYLNRQWTPTLCLHGHWRLTIAPEQYACVSGWLVFFLVSQ